jgi:signal transduction histidine kinase
MTSPLSDFNKNTPRQLPRISAILNGTMIIAITVASIIAIILVNYSMQRQALAEAEAKTRLILDRNRAVHEYFSQNLKPNVFHWSDPFRSDEYFDPSWMSSTYALREMGHYFGEFSPTVYYIKDAAVNARTPENEADANERAFLDALNADPQLEWRSEVQNIDGQPYLVSMRRGETLESSCLRCHGDPAEAPADLIAYYDDQRGFFRENDLGKVISVISIRVPLASAFAEASLVSVKLSLLFSALMATLVAAQFWLQKRLVWSPLASIREKVLLIAESQGHLSDAIAEPYGAELNDLVKSFNTMSSQLSQAQEKLVRQERLAALGQLAGSVSHELRNPLGVISNAVYFLKMIGRETDGKTSEYLDIITQETQNAQKIIKDLLDFSRVKSLERLPVIVSEVVQRAIQQTCISEQISVHLDLPAALPAIYADPRHIEQILSNIILNACQAMPDGGELSISAAVSQDHRSISIEISDTGVGIAPENMGEIFEPLYTTKPRGVGLGLPVCQTLAGANDGNIKVRSALGKGSTFVLTMPAQKEENR